MKPRFQADADLHPEIVAGVIRREPTIDFQSAQLSIPDGMPDSVVLEFAASQNRILVSHDFSTMPGHFKRFTAQNRSSPGLFLISQSTSIGRAIDDLILIWATSEALEWRGLIVRIPL